MSYEISLCERVEWGKESGDTHDNQRLRGMVGLAYMEKGY